MNISKQKAAPEMPFVNSSEEWLRILKEGLCMRNRKRKRQSRTGKICISCMVLVLTLIMSVQIVRLYHKDQDYQKQQQELQAQLDEEKQRAEDLEARQEYVGTDQYVEDVARQKLGMVYPDEIVFKEE